MWIGFDFTQKSLAFTEISIKGYIAKIPEKVKKKLHADPTVNLFPAFYTNIGDILLEMHSHFRIMLDGNESYILVTFFIRFSSIL